MHCLVCGDPRFRVTNTEHRPDGTYRWRRCRACNYLLRFREVPAPLKPGPKPGRKLPSNRGERNGYAVLTEPNVRDIRRLSESGMSNRAIAAQYGINAAHVSRIVNRKLWTHVP